MVKLPKIKKKFDYKAHMIALNAARTPESFAKSKENRSASMKKAWARKGPEARKEVNRKISATQTDRLSKIAPRAKRDREANRIKGMNDFYKKDTIDVQEHREYIGYLSSKNILECEPERKKIIVAKRSAGQKEAWDRLNPEERQERIDKTSGKGVKCIQKVHLLYETDVPRVKNYCGVVSISEMEKMHG